MINVIPFPRQRPPEVEIEIPASEPHRPPVITVTVIPTRVHPLTVVAWIVVMVVVGAGLAGNFQ